MTVLKIGFYPFTKFNAVYYRHYDIADDQLYVFFQ